MTLFIYNCKYNSTRMTTFHEQMKQLRADNEYRKVFPNDNWSAQDYKDIFWCIDKGYLVQNCGTSFIINEEWEGDDVYAEEFLEEEEEEDMNMDTPNYKQKIEEACPVGHITVWGDHGFIYEVELKEYNGVMLPKYINGREVLCYPNAGHFVEEKIEKCDKCDIRLGIYDGNYEMKVEWFGKTMCGKCAYVKTVYKLN